MASGLCLHSHYVRGAAASGQSLQIRQPHKLLLQATAMDVGLCQHSSKGRGLTVATQRHTVRCGRQQLKQKPLAANIDYLMKAQTLTHITASRSWQALQMCCEACFPAKTIHASYEAVHTHAQRKTLLAPAPICKQQTDMALLK